MYSRAVFKVTGTHESGDEQEAILHGPNGATAEVAARVLAHYGPTVGMLAETITVETLDGCPSCGVTHGFMHGIGGDWAFH